MNSATSACIDDSDRRMLAPFLILLAFFVSSGSFVLSSSPRKTSAGAAIRLVSIQQDGEFVDTAAPDSLQMACAPTVDQLESHFQNAKLPFDRGIVRESAGEKYCHIFYHPSVAGFRADPDNLPVTELFVDVDTTSFLARRQTTVGDALDIVKEITRAIARPLKIHLGASQHYESHWIDDARVFHFPNSIHQIDIRDSGSDTSSPWAQDYLKSGRVGENRIILVTRRLIENDGDRSASFEPLLTSFSDPQFVRSKLSWEGGDLQFVKSPKDPTKTILFYGAGAKRYWGNSLTEEEYRYVLLCEFGADLAVDFSDLVSHVDYFVSFLPEDNIALVSKPELDNIDLLKDSLRLLRQRFPASQGWEHLEFDRIRKLTAKEFRSRKYDLRDELKEAAESPWPLTPEPGLLEKLGLYVSHECPERPEACFDHEGRSRMLEKDINLLKNWISAALRATADQKLPGRLLSIVESQLPNFKPANPKNLEQKVTVLRDLGFTTVFVPRIAGDPHLKTPWAGISYANNLLIDKMLFVPRFGLGSSEDVIFENIQAQLPPGYRVLPIFARRTILFNGGLHCLFGIVRTP